MTERSKGEQNFIEQMTKHRLVDWATLQIISGDGRGVMVSCLPIYVDYALERGWITKNRETVTSKGFEVAASCLKSGAVKAFGR